LAAYRAGIKTLILPAWNRKDVEDIPANVRKSVTFHFVSEMMDVLELALEPEKETKRSRKAVKNPKALAKSKSAKPLVKIKKKKATIQKTVLKRNK